MNNMGDAFKKAGVEGTNTNNRPHNNSQQGGRSNYNSQHSKGTYSNGGSQAVNMTIDFKNGYDPVKEGEKLVNKMNETGERNFTTSQLRKILSYASVVNNKIQMDESNSKTTPYKIPPDLQNDVQYIKLKLIYQMGREPSIRKWFGSVDTFGIKGIGLDKIIADIGDSKEKFDRFYRLLESIVAFKKYLIKE